MSKILRSITRLLATIGQGCSEYPMMGILGPIAWPRDASGDRPER
jgi:hypothetical protein